MYGYYSLKSMFKNFLYECSALMFGNVLRKLLPQRDVSPNSELGLLQYARNIV